MEKTIKFEDVVALINKAMENKLNIQYDELNCGILITNKSNNIIIISFGNVEDTHKIFIRNGATIHSNVININISPKELAAFELLLYEVEEYAHNQVVDCLNHFLDEEVIESLKTIDNIDE